MSQQVEIGDKIISINDTNVENLTVCEAIKNPPLNGSSNLKIIVKKNNGEFVPIKIEKMKR